MVFSKNFSLVCLLIKFNILLFSLIRTQQSSNLDNLRIKTSNSVIYDKNRLNSFFDYNSQLKYSCVVPKVLEDDMNTANRIIKIENEMSCLTCFYDLTLKSFDIVSRNAIMKIKTNFTNPIIVKSGNTLNVNIDYFCLENQESEAWSLLTFNLGFEENVQNISFSYIKICKKNDSQLRFDNSLILLAILSIIMLGFASRFNSIIFFKNYFEKYEISLLFSLIYFIFCSISLLLIYYFGRIAIIIYITIASILAWISTFFVLLEFSEFLPVFLQCKINPFCYFKKITIGSIIMFFCSSGLVICWAIFKHFVLTDICAFSIIVFCLKILKINSLKQITIFMTLEMLFELMWGFIINNPLNSSYDVFFSSDLCLPVRLIIPIFSSFLHQNCSWLLISSLIFPGLFLSYLHKFDKCKNIHIYFRIGILSYSIGAVIWVIVACISGEMIPMSFFGFPIMLIFLLVFSYLRNEHTELWKGNFFNMNSMGLSQGDVNSNIKSMKSFYSNYNKEEVFEGLLSKVGSRESGGLDPKTFLKSESESEEIHSINDEKKNKNQEKE